MTKAPSSSQLTSWAQTHPGLGGATNQEGIPMPSLTASQAIGEQGNVLLQDVFLLEKTASFNRERVPERVVHAKGAGAMGFFQVTDDVSRYTKASVFNRVGKKTNVAVRLSTVVGELGSADTNLDLKGFATKFYSKDGIYDLTMTNFEVFPISDAMLLPDMIRSRKRNPATHLRDPNMFWDFSTLRPESTLSTLHLFSDEGTPANFRVMNAAAVNTYKWVNSSNIPVYIKYHYVSNQNYSYLSKEECESLAGTNPDHFIQDLYDSIASGNFPTWDLYVQIMTLNEAETHPQNPFDSTKHWRRDKYPMRKVGRLTLNQNPTDYFTQIEQIAFDPSNLIPGIEPSSDRLLNVRLFSYKDTQRHRIGSNFAQLPVNKATSRVQTYMRDGPMCFGRNGDGGPNYFPNSYGGPRENDQAVRQTSFNVKGVVDRIDTNDDNFSLCVLYLEDMDEAQRKRLADRLATNLAKTDPILQKRFLDKIAYKISKEFGNSINKSLDNVRGNKTKIQ